MVSESCGGGLSASMADTVLPKGQRLAAKAGTASAAMASAASAVAVRRDRDRELDVIIGQIGVMGHGMVMSGGLEVNK